MLKVAHNHWKLRKYTALAKTKAAQRENGLESAPSPTRRKKGNDIPFGVRAIESGIEVDGVWISRSNTPANSTPGSPFLSATKETPAQPAQPSDRASTASNMSRLEIPQPAHGHARSSPARSYNSGHSRVSGNPFDRSLSSDRSPSRISTYIDHTAHGAHRSTYQPRRASHLRYSNSHTTDNAEALASLEGRHLASKTGSKSSQGKTTSTGSLSILDIQLTCSQSPLNTKFQASVLPTTHGRGPLEIAIGPTTADLKATSCLRMDSLSQARSSVRMPDIEVQI